MKRNPKITPEARLCRLVMAMRDVDEHELARLTGCALGTIYNLLSCNAPYASTRIAIERALDCRIWSTPGQFRENQRKH